MRLAHWPLLPLVVPQALWVSVRALRLPEASGPRQGVTGQGPPLRLLVLGDSSAAGVGVATQEQAFTGQLVRRLSRTHRVDWRIQARSGATARDTLANLPEGAFDVVVIALGVNDAKNGVSQSAWRRRYTALLEQLDARLFVLSGVPPLEKFPALPRPLAQVLGARAAAFDQILRGLADGREDAIYTSLVFDLDARAMAEDGFHPAEPLYAAWAERVAEVLNTWP